MYIVSNAGTHPEPAHLASGLAQGNLPVIYGTSGSYAVDSTLAATVRQLAFLPNSITNQLKRRQLPIGLSATNVTITSLFSEILFLAMKKARPSMAEKCVIRRTFHHRQKMANVVSHFPNAHVIAQSTSALEPFKAKRGTGKRILMYPIAHHRWMQSAMKVEAQKNHEWAPYLQEYNLPAEQIRLREDEIALADHVIVPSTFAKQTFVDSGVPEDRVEVVLLGVDENELGSAETSHTGHSEGSSGLTTFLFAGQVNQRKGISYILDAFTKLSDLDCRLIIIGDADNALKAHILKQHRVTYHGPMPRPQLGQYMSKADVVLMPSLAEGFGLTALEAMAMKTVPVMSERTFAPDLIHHGVNGFIVPAGEEEGLHEVMHRLAINPSLVEKMSVEARNTAENRTWAKYQKESLDLLTRLTR